MSRFICRALLTLTVLVSAVPPAAAQATPAAPAQPSATPPAPPPPPWTGSIGLGFSMNRGNTSTTDFNVTFDATSDPKKKDVFRFKALYLRDTSQGELSADRMLVDARYERTLSDRVYGYAAVGFLKDQFKSIDYLWAPAGGIGYKLIATDTTTFNADAGLGAKIEKDTNADTRTDFAVTMADKFEHKLSKDSTITQGFTALWKASDFGDAVYTFTAGATAVLTKKIQVKVELLDAYVTRPPTAEIKSNDVALITSFVYKF
jgi:putative salt-induced outer membrane protein